MLAHRVEQGLTRSGSLSGEELPQAKRLRKKASIIMAF
jgi:hypothetical protein